jgi:hypothetical protein
MPGRLLTVNQVARSRAVFLRVFVQLGSLKRVRAIRFAEECSPKVGPQKGFSQGCSPKVVCSRDGGQGR